MKFGIIVFPGSNCDQDCFHVVSQVFNQPAVKIWHKETDLQNVDVVIIPGGFSYGDYLRCGAIARFSPIMSAVIKWANRGGKVLGICNGFQILIEAGLLPGTLMRNKDLQFVCDVVSLKLVNHQTPFTQKGKKGELYRLPIAHAEGNFFIDDDGFKKLQDKEQIIFQYVENPNGSVAHIAGISNEKKNILGMMPHPERVCEEVLGGTDGKFIFESLIGS